MAREEWIAARNFGARDGALSVRPIKSYFAICDSYYRRRSATPPSISKPSIWRTAVGTQRSRRAAEGTARAQYLGRFRYRAAAVHADLRAAHQIIKGRTGCNFGVWGAADRSRRGGAIAGRAGWIMPASGNRRRAICGAGVDVSAARRARSTGSRARRRRRFRLCRAAGDVSARRRVRAALAGVAVAGVRRGALHLYAPCPPGHRTGRSFHRHRPRTADCAARRGRIRLDPACIPAPTRGAMLGEVPAFLGASNAIPASCPAARIARLRGAYRLSQGTTVPLAVACVFREHRLFWRAAGACWQSNPIRRVVVSNGPPIGTCSKLTQTRPDRDRPQPLIAPAATSACNANRPIRAFLGRCRGAC